MRLRNKRVILSYLLLLVVLPFVASLLQGWIGGTMVNRQLSCANKSPGECYEWVKNLTALELDMRSRGISLHPNMTPSEMGRVAEVYTEYGIDLSGARTMAFAILIVEALMIGSLAAVLLRKKSHVTIIAGASFILSLYGAAGFQLVALFAVKAAIIMGTGSFILWYRES